MPKVKAGQVKYPCKLRKDLWIQVSVPFDFTVEDLKQIETQLSAISVPGERDAID
jgi:hypothetical protein